MGLYGATFILIILALFSCTKAWTPFITDGKVVEYTSWFSEEGEGYSGRQTAPIAGLECSGDYCDDQRLITVRDGDSAPVLDSAHWTPWFSDEDSSWTNCPSDMIVNELQCDYHYCDNLRMQCGRLASGYRIVSSDLKQVDWFSEEQGERRCPDGYYLWGMACRGDYCDERKLNCVRVDFEPPRPVYIITHRVNSVEDIEKAIDAGANAIECDVRYGLNLWWVDHDVPGTTGLFDWLVEAKRVADKKGDKFALIIFDIKTPERVDQLRGYVRSYLPANLNTLFSTGSYDDRGALNAIDQSLKSNEGVAIDFDNDPNKVQDHFVNRGVSNFWYGNGICAPCYGPNVRPSLEKARVLRDNGNSNGIKKTYVWTLASGSSIREYFKDEEVDGVMVNQGTVEEARSIAISEGRKIATRSDPAFERF